MNTYIKIKEYDVKKTPWNKRSEFNNHSSLFIPVLIIFVLSLSLIVSVSFHFKKPQSSNIISSSTSNEVVSVDLIWLKQVLRMANLPFSEEYLIVDKNITQTKEKSTSPISTELLDKYNQ